MSRVLVISPHPDDETIGCGGTLARHAAEGDVSHVVFLTSGERGGHGLPAEETKPRRESEARLAAEILGIERVDFWRAKDGAVEAGRPLLERLNKTLKKWRPHIVYVPHVGEMHPDHRAAARLVRRAVYPAGTARKGTPEVRMFEVWTPLQTLDHVVDISPYIERKLAAVRSYASQCAVMCFDEAVRGLNRYRGEMHSWPGGDYAEVFAEMKP